MNDNSSVGEDVNQELRRVMDLDQGDTTDTSDVNESSEHPTAPFVTSHPSPQNLHTLNKIHSPQAVSSGVGLLGFGDGQRPVTRRQSRGVSGDGRGSIGKETPFQVSHSHTLSDISWSRQMQSSGGEDIGNGLSTQMR